MRAWRTWDELRDRGALRTWLYRIATNACLDELWRTRPKLSRWTDAAEPDADWVEPYPDVLIDGLADPAGAYSLRSRALLTRYVDAREAEDVEAIAELLRDDARYGMPPLPFVFHGRAEIAAGLASAVLVPGARSSGCCRRGQAGGRRSPSLPQRTAAGRPRRCRCWVSPTARSPTWSRTCGPTSFRARVCPPDSKASAAAGSLRTAGRVAGSRACTPRTLRRSPLPPRATPAPRRGRRGARRRWRSRPRRRPSRP